MIKYAKLYREKLGWNVIPIVSSAKMPHDGFEWKHGFQLDTRKVTIEELDQWWDEYPDSDIGLLTGRLSGVVVFDCDTEEAFDFMVEKGVPMTAHLMSGIKPYKIHFYFKYPEYSKKRIPNINGMARRGKIKVALDVKADGGLAVLPPSSHHSGSKYKWMKYPWDVGLAELDQWMLEYIFEGWNEPRAKSPYRPNPYSKVPKWVKDLEDEGVYKGARDDSAYSLARFWFKRGLGEYAVRNKLIAWNSKCYPPLKVRQIEKCIRSAKHAR